MNAILERFSEIFSRFTDWTFVLAALLVAGIFSVVYYYLLRFLKNNRQLSTRLTSMLVKI